MEWSTKVGVYAVVWLLELGRDIADVAFKTCVVVIMLKLLGVI